MTTPIDSASASHETATEPIVYHPDTANSGSPRPTDTSQLIAQEFYSKMQQIVRGSSLEFVVLNGTQSQLHNLLSQAVRGMRRA